MFNSIIRNCTEMAFFVCAIILHNVLKHGENKKAAEAALICNPS